MRKFKELHIPHINIDDKYLERLRRISCITVQEQDTCRHIKCEECIYDDGYDYQLQAAIEKEVM